MGRVESAANVSKASALMKACEWRSRVEAVGARRPLAPWCGVGEGTARLYTDSSPARQISLKFHALRAPDKFHSEFHEI